MERAGGGQLGRQHLAGHLPAPCDSYVAVVAIAARLRSRASSASQLRLRPVDSGAARGWKGARAGQRVDRRRSYASSGPGWKIQEVSRVGAQRVTSKSKLLAREMPDLHTGGLRVDSGAARSQISSTIYIYLAT